ncbi:MAG: PIN domain-containing protein [Nitrospirae bacterium]|nr:PIN domain-containing protein [Nitrospirota bacterium]
MSKAREIFVDTGAFIAMRVKDDFNHEAASAYLNTIKAKRLRLHTTNFILDEVYTYFCRAHPVAVEMAELLMNNPLINLHRITVDDENNGWKILTEFADKDFSYTDATSFALIERLGIKTVFAFDEHFRQYGKLLIVP